MTFWLMGKVGVWRVKTAPVSIMESPIHLDSKFKRTATPGESAVIEEVEKLQLYHYFVSTYFFSAQNKKQL